MTQSREMMQRAKAYLVVGPLTERSWRNRRANNLATMIAWHRRHLQSAGEDNLRRIILDDIIEDIGWPRLSWLKPAVRAEAELIKASLPASSGDEEDEW